MASGSLPAFWGRVMERIGQEEGLQIHLGIQPGLHQVVVFRNIFQRVFRAILEMSR